MHVYPRLCIKQLGILTLLSYLGPEQKRLPFLVPTTLAGLAQLTL